MVIIRSYGLCGAISLAFDYMRTRLLYRDARIIRFPIHIRGKLWINMGVKVSIGRGLRIEAFGDVGKNTTIISIGNNVRINDYVHIGAIEKVVISDHVLIASKVFISDHNHGSYGSADVHSDPRVHPNDRQLSSSPVFIGEDVWIGECAAILPGVSIGKGSIIGALSTVTCDIPPYSIAIGSPARVIKTYNFEKSQWLRI